MVFEQSDTSVLNHTARKITHTRTHRAAHFLQHAASKFKQLNHTQERGHTLCIPMARKKSDYRLVVFVGLVTAVSPPSGQLLCSKELTPTRLLSRYSSAYLTQHAALQDVFASAVMHVRTDNGSAHHAGSAMSTSRCACWASQPLSPDESTSSVHVNLAVCLLL